MNQALYAHMNNKRKMKKKNRKVNKSAQWVFIQDVLKYLMSTYYVPCTLGVLEI
jgi:hypothetical protein